MARERTTYVYLPRSVRSLYKYMYSRGVYMSASTLQVLGCDHPLAQNCQYRANYFLRSTIRFYLTVYASSSGRLGVKEIRWQKRRKETYDMALSFVQCYAIATLTLVASWVCVCALVCCVLQLERVECPLTYLPSTWASSLLNVVSQIYLCTMK